MAKRLMCIVLSVLMIMTVLPAGVVATDSSGLPSSGTVSSGTYTLSDDITLEGMLTIESGSTVTIDLNGHTISYTSTAGINSSDGGTSRMIYNYGTLTITDSSSDKSGKICLNSTYTSTNTSSLTVYECIIETSGALYLNAGTLELNSAFKPVRGIVVLGSGSVTVNGGNLSVSSASSNQVVYGIYAGSESATVSIVSGSVIVECTNSSNTSAVYGVYGLSNGCSVSVSGGTIDVSGYSTESSYVIGIYGFTTTTVSDGTIIVTNKSEASSSNAYGVRGKSNSYASITGGTITVTSAGSSGTAYAAGYANISGGTITADKLLGTVTVTGGSYSFDVSDNLAEGYSATKDANGNYVVVIASTGVAKNVTQNISTYATLQDAIDAANEKDEIALLEDVKEDITIDYTDTITLDLAGYTLDGSITITGGDLTLKDSSTEQSGTVTGGVTVNAKVLFDTRGVSDSFLLLTNGGVVSEGTYYDSQSSYSVVSESPLDNGMGITGVGSFTMSSGTISGIVTVQNGSTFTMSNGTISGGVKLDDDGELTTVYTVVLDANGTVSSYSKTITNGYLTNTFAMSGGKISGNTATNGGGVYVGDCATFTMTGGTISDNTASYGGGVYLGVGSTFTLNGGVITNNTATAVGGGVYLSNEGTFTFSAGAIYGNTATTSAADIFIHENAISVVSIIAASSMSVSGYDAWYSDVSGSRYDASSNITDTVDVSTITGELSIVAGGSVTVPELYGYVLTLDGKVGVTMYFAVDQECSMDGYTLTAQISDDGSTYTDITVVKGDNITISGEDYYRYTVYVSPLQYCSTIKYYLKDANSVTVDTYEYSVSTYCARAIEKGWSEANLCAALMNYGNYTIKCLGDGNTIFGSFSSSWEDPVDNWTGSELNNYDIPETTETTGTRPDAIDEDAISVSLGLNSYTAQGSVTMYFYVTVSDSTEFTFEMNGTSVEADSYVDDVYCISVDIPAKNMLTGEYTLSIISSDESEYMVTYSILQYIDSTLKLTYSEDAIKETSEYQSATDKESYLATAKDEFDDLQTLCKALYCYAEAANAYWNS